MGTGTQVAKGEIITHTKMNLKLETAIAEIQDVISVRQFDILYKNNSPDKDLFLQISVHVQVENTENVEFMLVAGDDVSMPLLLDDAMGAWHSASGFLDVTLKLTGIVRPNQFYSLQKIVIGAPQVSLWSWWETWL